VLVLEMSSLKIRQQTCKEFFKKVYPKGDIEMVFKTAIYHPDHHNIECGMCMVQEKVTDPQGPLQVSNRIFTTFGYTDLEVKATILHEVGHIGQPPLMPVKKAELEASLKAVDMAVDLGDKKLLIAIKDHIRAYKNAPQEYAYVYKKAVEKGIIER
jgi:hypothetical protein